MLPTFVLGDEIVLKFRIQLAEVVPKTQEISNFGSIEHSGELAGSTGNL